jgi:hypothetical protein
MRTVFSSVGVHGSNLKTTIELRGINVKNIASIYQEEYEKITLSTLSSLPGGERGEGGRKEKGLNPSIEKGPEKNREREREREQEKEREREKERKREGRRSESERREGKKEVSERKRESELTNSLLSFERALPKETKASKLTCERVIINYLVTEKGCRPVSYDEKDHEWRCFHCQRPRKGKACGIPIEREDFFDPETKKMKIAYHCVDLFCVWSCAYKSCIIRAKLYPLFYDHSERLLKEIFAEAYPGEDLYPARDQHWLKTFNGPLDWDKFHERSDRGRYHDDHMKWVLIPTLQYVDK